MATTVKIGETAILGVADSNNGNLILAQQAVLAQAATIRSLSFYVTTVGGHLRLGIYSNSNSRPGLKLAETAAFVAVAGWNTQPTLTKPLLPPGTYWLVYLPESSALGFRKGNGPTSYLKTFAYGVLPATFPTGLLTTTSHWSFYATLDSEPPPPPGTPVNITVTNTAGLKSMLTVYVIPSPDTIPPSTPTDLTAVEIFVTVFAVADIAGRMLL